MADFWPKLLSSPFYRITLVSTLLFDFPKVSIFKFWAKSRNKIDINKPFCNFLESGARKLQTKNQPVKFGGW